MVGMSTTDHLLGRCPSCTGQLTWTDLLIEYADRDGTHAVFAECPTCSRVIEPAEPVT